MALSLIVKTIILFAIGCTSATLAPGTPKNIEEIFKGRCYEYQQVVQPDVFKNGNKPINCSILWEKFSRAFRYKDPCSVEKKDYEDYVEYADHTFETTDRVLYWSGAVYPFIVEYAQSGKKFITIRDTLMAYAIKSIDNWCGQVRAPGINYENCPEWGACPNLATTSFWRMLSKKFASKVKGTIHLMLNASSLVAYNNASIFAKSELANLNKERTPTLHVHLVSNLDQQPRETCASGSLVQLRTEVERKSMKFICSEREQSIYFFQCANTDNSRRCDLMAMTLRSRASTNHNFIQIAQTPPLFMAATILFRISY